MNIPSKIIPQLYLGTLQHARDISLLQELQIKHVLSVINAHEAKLLPKFYLYDIQNRQYEPINVRHENILIHCHMGISRSVTIVVAFLMNKWHLSTQDTLIFVRTKRSICNPNDGFVYQLNLYNQMNYRLDIQNKEFRHFLLYKTIFPFLSIDTVHQMLEKYWYMMQQYERLNDNQQQQQWYRCRKCSYKLFNDIHILESNRLLFQYPTTIRFLVRRNIFLWEISGKNCMKLTDFDSLTCNKISSSPPSSSNQQSNFDCNQYIIEPLQWTIKSTFGEMDTDYQLHCPGCSTVIGTIQIRSTPKIQCKCSIHCDCFSIISIVVDKKAVIV
ncbi:dual specificity phosphatase 12 [Dermatophagoides pteronyssinus]|uniref:protein-tyrosine-phosphatase n=1 Tax=Dermatophagoides pteronyssinus TaxID=6956 RepID=A0ABQ8IQK4_DERPT|nr:dual specificity phosphatase 12 [Dermatophagoides pteronyssinus]